MTPYRRLLDPGGQSLARRIDRLRDTFNDLAARLRTSVAEAVGETLGSVIRDAVQQVLDHLAGSKDDKSGLPSGSSQWEDRRRESAYGERDWRRDDDPFEDHRPDLWAEGRYEDDVPDEPEPAPASNPRLAVSVATGLQVACWLLRRQEKKSVLATLGLGLLACGVGYVIPSLASSFLNLAGSAVQLGTLSNIIGSNGTLLSNLGLI